MRNNQKGLFPVPNTAMEANDDAADATRVAASARRVLRRECGDEARAAQRCEPRTGVACRRLALRFSVCAAEALCAAPHAELLRACAPSQRASDAAACDAAVRALAACFARHRLPPPVLGVR